MQTEAAPREPFTIGVLFRYKFTIFAIACFVMLGGYVRIITQPKLYEATARVAVRFSAETLAFMGGEGGPLPRLPLLEEEVKAYTSLLRDRRIIAEAIEDLPGDNRGGADQEEPETAAQKFRGAFLSAYYSLRKAVYYAIGVITFSTDIVMTDKEQRVNQILSRMEVTAGEEASHIITVSYQNPDPAAAAQLVNTLSKKFIEMQKRRVKRKDEEKPKRALDDAVGELHANRKAIYDLANGLQSPNIEEAIRRKYSQLDTLLTARRRYDVASALLDAGVVPFDKDLPLESPSLLAELERTRLEYRMRYEQLMKESPEKAKVLEPLLYVPDEHMKARRQQAMANDKAVVAAQMAAIEAQVKKLNEDTTLANASPEFTRLQVEQDRIQKKIAQAETELNEVRNFNKELDDENVSENIALWQPAVVPPFPLPQYREAKLLVVIALGLFAGCAAALVRHQLKPKPLRRPRPRSEAEAGVPVVILPDEGKAAHDRERGVDISFPPDDSQSGLKGREARR